MSYHKNGAAFRLVFPLLLGVFAIGIGLMNLLFASLDESLQLLSGIVTLFGLFFSVSSIMNYIRYKNLKTENKKGRL